MRSVYLLVFVLLASCDGASDSNDSDSNDSDSNDSDGNSLPKRGLGLGGDSASVSPRIYIYHLPKEYQMYIHGVHMSPFSRDLLRRIKQSPHYEHDGDRADYYWIPGEGSLNIEWVKSNHPWWNMTVERGESR